MTTQSPAQPAIGQAEFIALIAMLFATIAFSIDSMLPALPRIALDLTPDAPNKAQLILTSFLMGMGFGTLFAGPLSDTFGRRRTIVAGAFLYCLGSLAAYFAPTLETVLIARVLQGIGAAGPRVVSLALVRDVHSGRQMARVVSFAMMIFTLVPAVAPLLGSYIIDAFGWRSIFLSFIGFSTLSILWMLLRQPETLPVANRRPFRAAPLWAALREVLSHRLIRLSIVAQTLAFAALFATLSTAQPIFDLTYDRAASFPLYFALIALLSGTSSLLNASLVVRYGMRRLILITFGAQMIFSAAITLALVFGVIPDFAEFSVFLVWTISVFFMAGMTLGNLNALGLEPVGHISGMAASVIGSISTVASVVVAVPIGLMFDGTAVPLMASIAVLMFAGFLVMVQLDRPKRN